MSEVSEPQQAFAVKPWPWDFGPISRDFREGNTGIPWCQGKSHKIKGSFLDGPQNMGVLSQVGERAGGCVLLGFPSASALASPKCLCFDLGLDLEAAGGGQTRQLEDAVSRKCLEYGLNTRLQFRLCIEGKVRAQPGQEMLLEELRHRPETAVEEERGDERLEGRGQDRGSPSAFGLLAFSH